MDLTVSTKMGVVRKDGILPPISSCKIYSTSKESGPVGTSVVENRCDFARVCRGQSGNRWLLYSSNSVPHMTLAPFSNS